MINRSPTKKYIYVDTPQLFQRLIEEITVEPVVAVDTESDSLHSYFDKVCLIQFSIPTEDYLLDPLAVDASGLASFFADETIQKVFHAAEYDVLTLKRDYSFEFVNLFDTMVAARILGWPRYGLASVLMDKFNIKLNKRFQRYDWGQRPLGKKALNYARLDTHYLLPLREVQLKLLSEQNRRREARDAFERQTWIEPHPRKFDPDDFWRVKHSRKLEPDQLAVLRELWILRDKIARKIDRPYFKVVTDATLINLAKQQPASKQDLKRMKGLSRGMLRYNSNALLQAIQTGQESPNPHYKPPPNNQPNEQVLARYETLRHWRNHRANERGVEPDVIISNNTLMRIARRNPQSLKALTQMEATLGQWQCEVYGRDLLELLQEVAA